MSRPSQPHPDDYAEEQARYGNIDPASVDDASALTGDLRKAFDEGLIQVKALLTDPKATPTAKTQAWRAIAEVLGAKDLVDKKKKPQEAAGPQSSPRAQASLVQLLRQFGEDQARAAFDEAFAQEPYEVLDLSELDTL